MKTKLLKIVLLKKQTDYAFEQRGPAFGATSQGKKIQFGCRRVVLTERKLPGSEEWEQFCVLMPHADVEERIKYSHLMISMLPKIETFFALNCIRIFK